MWNVIIQQFVCTRIGNSYLPHWEYELKGREIWIMIEGLCIPVEWEDLCANIKGLGLGNFHRNTAPLPLLAIDRYSGHVCVLWVEGWYGEK